MRIYRFSVPIFDYNIALVFGDLAGFRAWLKRNGMTDAPGEYDGLTIHPPATSAILVYIADGLSERRKNSVIFHEALHAANYIFDDLHIKQDTESDEGTAMLQTFIAEKIIQRIGGKDGKSVGGNNARKGKEGRNAD